MNRKVYRGLAMYMYMHNNGKRRSSYILTVDSLNNIVRRRAEKLSNDKKLINMILSWEEWLRRQHLRHDATSTPQVNRDIVRLPIKHYFRRSIIPCRNIACHMTILDTSKSKVANLEIAALINENIAWLEIAMNNTSRVDKFQAAL
jgi:hypothetical protein